VSEENVKVVERSVDAWKRGDPDEVYVLNHPEIVFDSRSGGTPSANTRSTTSSTPATASSHSAARVAAAARARCP
jgi:hypothetical protein